MQNSYADAPRFAGANLTGIRVRRICQELISAAQI